MTECRHTRLLADHLLRHQRVQEGDRPDEAQYHLIKYPQLPNVEFLLVSLREPLGLYHV